MFLHHRVHCASRQWSHPVWCDDPISIRCDKSGKWLAVQLCLQRWCARDAPLRLMVNSWRFGEGEKHSAKVDISISTERMWRNFQSGPAKMCRSRSILLWNALMATPYRCIPESSITFKYFLLYVFPLCCQLRIQFAACTKSSVLNVHLPTIEWVFGMNLNRENYISPMPSLPRLPSHSSHNLYIFVLIVCFRASAFCLPLHIHTHRGHACHIAHITRLKC